MSFFLWTICKRLGQEKGKRMSREHVESKWRVWGECGEWMKNEREREGMRRVSEERMWGVMECMCEWKKSACGVWMRCVWSVCERVKGEHIEVCVSVGAQEKKSTQEKAESTRECREYAASSCKQMREREKGSREWERRERNFKPWNTACWLISKQVACVCLLCAPRVWTLYLTHAWYKVLQCSAWFPALLLAITSV